MRPSEALERHREEVRAIVRRFDADNPRLFGSVARGEDVEGSDIDILVDLPRSESYRQIFRIEDAIETLLGCKVEVYPADNPKSRFYERISEDLRPI
ncbi:nucleotidyltransferase family protein [Aureimonas sp. SK2]|uniref:nucleotidyltransferase family protein n=1 Tax=Aureimonas sp. SK2 TaxID=3015992 RepID=UPI002444950A|nr:nucleotidyltransferase domain-containing protein [Aureimonas sp. SK2]